MSAGRDGQAAVAVPEQLGGAGGVEHRQGVLDLTLDRVAGTRWAAVAAPAALDDVHRPGVGQRLGEPPVVVGAAQAAGDDDQPGTGSGARHVQRGTVGTGNSWHVK